VAAPAKESGCAHGIHHQQYHQDPSDGAGAFRGFEDHGARRQIEVLTRGYATKETYFVDTLARGIAKIAAPHYPNPVIVRLSRFQSNEYAHLIGGAQFEIARGESHARLRGASRYYSDHYKDGSPWNAGDLKAREDIGFDN